MKNILLAMVLMVAGICTAQDPAYNMSTHVLTWTITADTTQQMFGCSTNNYNAEGQCTGSTGWYTHTGNVLLQVKNLRTGLSSGMSQTVQGGIATATITLDALPGDRFSYTKTNRVFCPVINQWTGVYMDVGMFELADTFFKNDGDVQQGVLFDWYKVENWCSNVVPGNVQQPDYNTNLLSDLHTPVPWGWHTVSVCWSFQAQQPYACSSPFYMYKYTSPQARNVCSYNP